MMSKTLKILYLIGITSICLFLLLSVMDLKINAQTETTKTTRFLTVEEPTLGFRISYPSDWNFTSNELGIYFSAPRRRL